VAAGPASRYTSALRDSTGHRVVIGPRLPGRHSSQRARVLFSAESSKGERVHHARQSSRLPVAWSYCRTIPGTWSARGTSRAGSSRVTAPSMYIPTRYQLDVPPSHGQHGGASGPANYGMSARLRPADCVRRATTKWPRMGAQQLAACVHVGRASAQAAAGREFDD